MASRAGSAGRRYDAPMPLGQREDVYFVALFRRCFGGCSTHSEMVVDDRSCSIAAPARRFARADDGGGLRRCASRASREGLSRGRLIATPEHDEFFCATDPFAFFNVLAHFFGSSHAFLAAALRSAPTSTLTRAAWVRHVLHARMGCMPACVSWCAPCIAWCVL